MEQMGDEKLAQMRWDQVRKTDGRTVLGEIWEEWEENGEQQQQIEGVGDWLLTERSKKQDKEKDNGNEGLLCPC